MGIHFLSLIARNILVAKMLGSAEFFLVFFTPVGPSSGVSVLENRFRGYKTFFMLNLAEHKIYYAHKC